MSVTRAGELLEQVQRVAWDLAFALPEARGVRLRSARAAAERDIHRTSPHGLGSRGLDREELGWQLRRLDTRETLPLPPAGRERLETAGVVGRALLAGWPGLAAAAGHALTAVPLDPGPRDVLVRSSLDRVSGWGAQAEPDARLRRMGELLGAVADLLAGEPRAVGAGDVEDAFRARSRILATVETAARWTSATVAMWGADRAGMASDFERLGARAHDAVTHPPGQRSGGLDDVTAVTRDDPTLAGAVARWRLATREAVDPAAAAGSSRGVQAAAADLGLVATWCAVMAGRDGVLPAAQAARVRGRCVAAGEAWSAAAAPWTAVRAGGAMREEQTLASLDLRQHLQQAALAGAVDLASTVRRAMVDVERLGHRYQAAVGVLVASEALVVPAKVLARTERPVRLETMHAARRDQWVPLPRLSPITRALVETAHTAVTATGAARAQAGATARRPGRPFPIDLVQEASGPTHQRGPVREATRAAYRQGPGTIRGPGLGR